MKKGFTLVELIIVVVILGIIALIALPRYFANLAQAREAAVQANLRNTRDAAIGHFATYGTWPTAFPISVDFNGDQTWDVMMFQPATPRYAYQIATAPNQAWASSDRTTAQGFAPWGICLESGRTSTRAPLTTADCP